MSFPRAYSDPRPRMRESDFGIYSKGLTLRSKENRTDSNHVQIWYEPPAKENSDEILISHINPFYTPPDFFSSASKCAYSPAAGSSMAANALGECLTKLLEHGAPRKDIRAMKSECRVPGKILSAVSLADWLDGVGSNTGALDFRQRQLKAIIKIQRDDG